MICPCGRGEATEIWIGEGELDLAHGGTYHGLCRRCVLERQIAHCREAVERLPTLEAALAVLEATTTVTAKEHP